MILPSLALRRLLALRLVGSLRKQARRARSLRGALFVLLGLAAIGLWIAGFVYSQRMRRGGSMSQDDLRFTIQVGGALFGLSTILGGLAHRGLYLPRDEIERLLCAPLERADIVRYRIWAGLLRAFPGSAILAAFVAHRAAHPWLAAPGIVLCMWYLSLLAQATSLGLGSAENRLMNRLARLPLRGVNVLLGLVVLGLMGSAVWGVERVGLALGGRELRSHWPAMQSFLLRATSPLSPFADLVGAPNGAAFLRSFAVLGALWLGLLEVVARLGIDFRELSFDTSANVAKRLRRYRAVGGLAASAPARVSFGTRHIPRLFGAGPFGAVAWRKSCSLARKARGTLFVAGLLLFALIAASRFLIGPRGAEEALLGGSFVAGLGALYLCLGLRFDFREDLERMEQVKSWPLAPSALFLATILPEVLVVSVLVLCAVLLRCVGFGQYDARLLAVGLVVPVWVMAWAAIDNAVLLLAPVRPTPGQEGALHYAGRAVVLLVLRALVAAAVFAVAALVFVGLEFLGDTWGWPARLVLAAQVAAVFAVMALAAAVLVWLGGKLLRRFDVARDRSG